MVRNALSLWHWLCWSVLGGERILSMGRMIEGRVRFGKDVLGNEKKSLMIDSNENIIHHRSHTLCF